MKRVDTRYTGTSLEWELLIGTSVHLKRECDKNNPINNNYRLILADNLKVNRGLNGMSFSPYPLNDL